MQRYTPYKKELDYTYTFGIFPTLELLNSRPNAVEAILVAPDTKDSTGLQHITSLANQHRIPITTDLKAIRRLAKSENCYALGVVKKYPESLSSTAPHVVLVQPDDAGNLGTIMRTMLGFGHADLAILRPAVDSFDPKVLRASMGARFKIRVAYFTTIEEYRLAFDTHKMYPFLLQGTQLLSNTTFAPPYSLIFGNEGAGLPTPYASLGIPVKIEQNDAIDSLNLAVATSVALYHAFTHTR